MKMRLIRQQTWLNPSLVAIVIAVLSQSSLSSGSNDRWHGPINAPPSYDIVQDISEYQCPFRCDCFIDNMKTQALWINCTYPSFEPEYKKLVEEDLHPDYTTTLILTCSFVPIHNNDVTPETVLWDGAFARLRGLRELVFDGCLIRRLERSAFKGLSRLQTLSIRGANLNHLERDLFDELPGLTDIEISYSSLRYLPVLCASSNLRTSNLRTLNLTGNHLDTLEEAGLFCPGGGLSSLEVLDINRNFLTEIPLWLGRNLPQLYRLGLADNYISRASRDTFKFFSSLHVLDITNNSFTSFSADLFLECNNLIVLGLSGNNVTRLPRDLLSPLPRILRLELANMALDDRMWMEILDLQLMVSLNVSYNQLTSINADVMTQFPHLENILASHNKIRDIPQNAFKYQTKLKLLDFSYNALPAIPKLTLDDEHGLEQLYLDHNNITMIGHNSLAGMKELKILILARNRIPLLTPKVFADQVNLRYLDVSQNNMVLIAADVFVTTSNIEYLNVSHNSLTSFPLLSKVKLLKTFDMSYNNLTSMHAHTFKDISQLEFLNVSHNQLSSVHNKLLADCKNIKTVDFSHNNIKTLGAAFFRSAFQLKTIDISYNQISDINQVFAQTKILTNLDLSHNKLTQILRGNFPLSIQHLNLQDNQIAFISAHTFKSMNHIKSVNLQRNRLVSLSKMDVEVAFNMLYEPVFLINNNPFVCDCRLGWLKDWIDGRLEDIVPLPDFKIVAKTYDFHCSSPFSKVTKPLAVIDRSRFLCNYTDHCDSSCMCCEFDSCYCKYKCPSSCHCFIGDDYMHSHQVHCSLAHLAAVPLGLPEGATDLRLDGNSIPILHKHAFLALKHVEILYINNSQIHTIQNNTFKGLKSVRKLFLHDNFLSTIYDVTFDGLDRVEEIYLQNNDIFFIDRNALLTPPRLTRVNLQDNALMTTTLKDFDRFINRSLTESTKARLSLSRNPWTCDADFSFIFLQFLISNSDFVDDYSVIECIRPVMVDSVIPLEDTERRLILDLQKDVRVDNTTHANNDNITGSQNMTNVGRAPSQSEMYALIATCVIAAFIIVLIVVAYFNRHLIQVFCFTRFGFRAFKMAKAADDSERPYDAFISYSNKDEDFVVRQLAPRLEKGDRKYKLCVHYRDFPVGACIAETIVRSVEASKRTIMVVSDNFLESEWCRFEFQTAHQQVLSERRNRVILILMPNLDVSKLDNSLNAYMRSRTYLKYDDAWFWEKLVFAMPDVRNRKTNGDSIHLNRQPSNREFEYIARDPRLAFNSPPPSHPPFLNNGTHPHSYCESMRNDMYEIPVLECPSEHYHLAKVGSISPHTNSAFYPTESHCNNSTLSGYHNGSIGGSSLPHYEEVGPGNYSLNSTPQKKLIIETPPPLPRLPKEGFVPRDRMTFV